MQIGIQFQIHDITPAAIKTAAAKAVKDNPGFEMLSGPVLVDFSVTVYKLVKIPDITEPADLINSLLGTIINDPSQVKLVTLAKRYTRGVSMLYLISIRPEGEPCQLP